jgi:hypothetical protein
LLGSSVKTSSAGFSIIGGECGGCGVYASILFLFALQFIGLK